VNSPLLEQLDRELADAERLLAAAEARLAEARGR